MSRADQIDSVSELDQISVNINTLFKFIKPYDGDRDRLVPYLNTVDSAFSLATEEQEPILLAYTKAQLTGRAEAACSNHTFDTWEELKNYLKTMYSDKKHHGHYLMELQACKQLPNEKIAQYMYRVETALKRVLTSTQQTNTNETELQGRLATMTDLALHTFILNTKPEISQMLRSRNITNLNDAYNVALEEEKIQLLMHEQQNKNKMCGFCKKSGHSSFNCYKKNSVSNFNQGNSKNFENFDKKRAIPERKTFMGNANSLPPYKSLKFCNYCKKNGHLISECRKRMFNENKRNDNSKPSSSGNVRNLVTDAATVRDEEQFAAIIRN